jgi:hypothetical protein
MEFVLMAMLMATAVLFTLLSFILPNVIVLRLISGMLLISFALVVNFPTLMVGFGSLNPITYGTSQAGDPGRSGELEVFTIGFGLIGVFQILWSLVLMLKLVFPSTVVNQAEGYI